MAFLEKVHGRNAQIAYENLNNFLASHSPKYLKRAYCGIVIVPVTFTANVVKLLLEPIEQISSAGIHLVGAAFAKDKKNELLQARYFIAVALPTLTFYNIFELAVSPIEFCLDEADALVTPIDFENKRKKVSKYDSFSVHRKYLISLVTGEEDKKILIGLWSKTEKYTWCINLRDTLATSRIYIKYDLTRKFKIYEDNIRAQNANQNNRPEERTNAASQAAANKLKFDNGVKAVQEIALKYKVVIKPEALAIIQNKNSTEKEIAKALDPVRKRLSRDLHPDKTVNLPDTEKRSREEEFKKLNNAWGVIGPYNV